VRKAVVGGVALANCRPLQRCLAGDPRVVMAVVLDSSFCFSYM
jgi:hypothetical protein